MSLRISNGADVGHMMAFALNAHDVAYQLIIGQKQQSRKGGRDMYHDVPCELCLGTGKRKVFAPQNQPTLPVSVLIEAEQVFGNCQVETSFENDGFVLRTDVKGTYEDILQRQNNFHEWLNENYPAEISEKIILSINRVEIREKPDP